jgi:ubiquinone/menaquinone biosynthesis C-methylase UbiE
MNFLKKFNFILSMEDTFANFLLEKIQRDYNLIGENFSKARERPWEEAQFLVRDYLKEGEKILDFGCGAGQWYELFGKEKVQYFGVDFSKKLIEIAKSRYPTANFQVIDGFHFPFESEFFDKVYAIAVFHHLPSEKIRVFVLKEIKRVLKKGGILILTVWNLRKKWKAKKLILKFSILKIFGKTKLDFGDVLMDWMGVKDFYFHCFSQRELKNLISKASFNIIKIGEFLVRNNFNIYLIAKNESSL